MNWETCGLGDAWIRCCAETRRRGTHESGTMGHGARECESSPRRGTVRMSTRKRGKEASPDFCALCVKYNFMLCPERSFIKLLWEPKNVPPPKKKKQ